MPPGTFKSVRCHGLHGTYDDGLAWLQRPENQARPSAILFLGSSIGNFDRQSAADFLKGFSEVLRPSDVFIVGIDGCQDEEKVFHAYNDRKGITEDFYRNGLDNANKILGVELFKQDQWDVIGEFDRRAGRHQAFIAPRQDITAHGFSFTAGERIRIEDAYKYNPQQRARLWEDASLQLGTSYSDRNGHYCTFPFLPKHLRQRAHVRRGFAAVEAAAVRSVT